MARSGATEGVAAHGRSAEGVFRRIDVLAMFAEMDGSRITKDRAKALRRTLSLPEVLLWKAIKGGAVDRLQFRKQHPVGPYVLDFYCHAANLAVEVDGASHGAGDRLLRDERRDAWLAAQGIATLRLPASLILRDVDAAVRTIAGYLQHGD